MNDVVDTDADRHVQQGEIDGPGTFIGRYLQGARREGWEEAVIDSEITPHDITHAAELCLAYVEHGEDSKEYSRALRLCLSKYGPSRIIQAVVVVACAVPSHLIDEGWSPPVDYH